MPRPPCFERLSCDYGSLGNGVDLEFMGFPPFAQEKAERMGHGSLQQKQKCHSDYLAAAPAMYKSTLLESTSEVPVSTNVG